MSGKRVVLGLQNFNVRERKLGSPVCDVGERGCVVLSLQYKEGKVLRCLQYCNVGEIFSNLKKTSVLISDLI